jgi:hypothetical protein
VIDLTGIKALLKPHGLLVLGVADQPGPKRPSSLVLVGNTGSEVWARFLASAEFADGYPDPLDRWSRRIGEAVAAELGAEVVFPFDGPPYPPFLEWARESGAAFSSPLSMFIHTEHGLWHAYRFALRLESLRSTIDRCVPALSPCLSCVGQPCLDACPVEAFSDGHYRVDDCLSYLAADQDSNCRKNGCSARRACPVTKKNQYVSEHARFHMDAFVRSHLLRK